MIRSYLRLAEAWQQLQQVVLQANLSHLNMTNVRKNCDTLNRAFDMAASVC
jgi:hypothetical protein